MLDELFVMTTDLLGLRWPSDVTFECIEACQIGSMCKMRPAMSELVSELDVVLATV